MVTSDHLESMHAVDIKELNARLSAYIRRARSGQTSLVTDRNQAVARLWPVDVTSGARPESELLMRLRGSG